MKKIFLSASIPLPHRDPKYYETSDIIAIRDAVIALASVVLPSHKIIWGGHPSITPLIYFVLEKMIINNLKRNNWDIPLTNEETIEVQNKLKNKIQNHVTLYQSLFFKDIFPIENKNFENVVLTEDKGDKLISIQHMREQMLSKKHKFDAAVFIGGMDGIEIEYEIFKKNHPTALILPIASTGAATKILYDQLPEKQQNQRFLKDYGYMSLFQKFLMDAI
ncbi:TPA: hypothetical protein ACGZ94_003432 [Elizabethkingia anophelis]